MPAGAVTEPGAVRIRRALLSVSDKRGIVDFARGLAELGVELVSTGGTAQELERRRRSTVRAIDDLTGFPRSWTAASRRCTRSSTPGCSRCATTRSTRAAAEHDIEFVDLVCVNLYPFERTAARRGVERRRGHREHRHRRPDDDPRGGEEPRVRGGRRQAREPTTRCSRSCATADGTAVDGRRARRSRPRRSPTPRATTRRSRAGSPSAARTSRRCYVRAYEKVVDLPYGENPHQRAAYYQQVGARMHVLSMVQQHHGKQLSFNNLLDLDAARAVVREFEVPACVIVKHNNPCGVALGRTVARGLRARLRVRSAERVRRHHRASTAGSTARRPRRSPSSSSRCCSRPATTTARSRC